ncbi:fatty acid desaturase [Vibrio breoganii]|uniref:acyl-CoA desaturase n=1 Tax=Vibrio breoganii TaxID=553239 RepID=UPI000C866CD6|nr:fatty acid desaturase [Vibrio breoganii]PMK41215.1 acyl-CoA desaturase [Vibrio breoganii]PMO72892.1 acyl-CoA desaturase [Vibrio breoganii]PMO87783.1 acyl-CoA desaturase [Vibrio breoganii]
MSPQRPPLLWFNIFIFVSSLLLAAVVTPWYAFNYGLSWAHLIWFVIAFSFTNLSITAGYHRLWSHKTYQASPVLKAIFAIGGAFSLQNSALHWSSDHREHHKHVDHDVKDPYSASRGFWYSHMGWMLRDYNQETYSDYQNCRDLKKDNIVQWQHKYYGLLAVVTNFGFPILLGVLYNDIIGMFLVVGAVRLVLSHHTTFFINSLAHIWGKQTFTNKNSARDNGILAFFTFGEGYHNFHHLFENDYRNGISWWHYDPTKWLIKACSWVGLTEKLRVTPQFKIEKARATMMLQNAHQKLNEMDASPSLSNKLEQEFESLIESMRDYYDSKMHLLQNKKQQVLKSHELEVLKIRHQQLKEQFKYQQQMWMDNVKRFA